MNTVTDDTTFDIDIACSLSVAEQAERGEEWGRLLADAEVVTELSEGYGLRFPNRDAWVTRAVEVIIAERKCCPFFAFSLTFEPGGGPLWLHISGPGEVKSFIREQVVPSHLRSAV